MNKYSFDKHIQNALGRVRKSLEDKQVILASASPRRKELLSLFCGDFEVKPADIDENVPEIIPVQMASEYLAREKCRAVALHYPDAVVIGSDTTVIVDDTILGKPTDEADAGSMLKTLSGRTHSVISGIAVCCKGKMKSSSDETPVVFSKLDDEFISAYIKTGSPLDKAGAYGIQELDASVAHIESGSLTNVIGLPVEELALLLDAFLREV